MPSTMIIFNENIMNNKTATLAILDTIRIVAFSPQSWVCSGVVTYGRLRADITQGVGLIRTVQVSRKMLQNMISGHAPCMAIVKAASYEGCYRNGVAPPRGTWERNSHPHGQEEEANSAPGLWYPVCIGSRNQNVRLSCSYGLWGP